jgi:Glycosyl transferase family group 2
MRNFMHGCINDMDISLSASSAVLGDTDSSFASRQHEGISALISLGGQAEPSQSREPVIVLESYDFITASTRTSGARVLPDAPGNCGAQLGDCRRGSETLPARVSTVGRGRRLIALLCLAAGLAVLYELIIQLKIDLSFRVFANVQVAAISVVGVRLLSYYHGFVVHCSWHSRRREVTTAELRRLNVPNVRFHVTTRGLAGSTEVIRRGIRNLAALAAEDPIFYGERLSVEICTESCEQARLLQQEFGDALVPVLALVLPIPEDYQTPAGTLKKARSLHYMVEQRRAGWGRRHGKTFIVHYDEESVMEPVELRWLLRCLATTDKKILEGPIYYPLDYTSTSPLCRAMEANRPIGCFECWSVMESGVPLHLHGSNLVVEEQFENDIGWDMGTLDGQPFIAEDYVFGLLAFLKGGREVFGWHGAVMLEQPPFSYRSAFKQRQRWITGVLQGQRMMLRMEQFRLLPRLLRIRLIWGTRFRIFSFAIGAPVGLMFFAYVALVFANVLPSGLSSKLAPPLPLALMAWLSLVGLMWLGSVFIGASLNVGHTALPAVKRASEIAKVMTLAPLAGMCESAAGLWAVLCWIAGNRRVSWQPTPKTKQADLQMDWAQG